MCILYKILYQQNAEKSQYLKTQCLRLSHINKLNIYIYILIYIYIHEAKCNMGDTNKY